MVSTIVMPAAACLVVSWIGLVLRFHGRGRLSGTRQARRLFCLVLAATTAIAVATCVYALPHASSLPPIAVGVATGAAVVPREKAPNSGRPVTALLTFGISWLLGALSRRLTTDRADWCEEMTLGVMDGYSLVHLSSALRTHLLARLEEPGFGLTVRTAGKRQDEIEQRFVEAKKAAERSIKTETDVEKTQRSSGRLITPEEKVKAMCHFGEARHACQLLLHLAHDHGRRSSDAVLRGLRDEAAFHSSPPNWREVPSPRSGTAEASSF
ncbi:hypothetical protein [Streptomyces sp.]|uniref:hypothetical protein n=1 Tax=Streptomyces sp. TaxID=1931 RepID=UPI002D774747|nr:hypothetical protein [Streptomyces sp.]HET6353492.1 hypothetical protein [Streptomyces sp.]